MVLHRNSGLSADKSQLIQEAAMHKWFKVLLVVSILAGIAVFSMGAESSCGSSKTTSAPASGPGSSAEPIKVEPAALVTEFDANKINAQDKYNGKVVQSSGVIKNVSNTGDDFYLNINPTADQYYFGTSFSCHVSKTDAAAVANGQQVAFKGTVDDISVTMIQFRDCTVVK